MFGYGLFQTGVRLDQIQINNLAASVANKVGMGGGVSIKAFLPVYNSYTLNTSVLLEKIQITVDRSKTEIGVCRF